jgi:hypothetical protein
VRPFANWQGWEELNRAIYALQCVLIWSKLRAHLDRGSTIARIESDLHTFHSSLARSRKCDRPALP